MDTVLILRGLEPNASAAHDSGTEIKVRGQRQADGLSVPRIEAEQVTAGERAELLRDPEVSAVSLVMPTKLIEPLDIQPPAQVGGATWGVAAVGAVDSPYGGAGVTLAMLDTGIDRGHTAFQGVTIVERDFTDTDPGDADGHGTHCAGTILGRDTEGVRIGVATAATRMLVGKVLADDGAGSSQMLFDALLWARAEGAQVISMSIGLDFPGMVRSLTTSGWPLELATSRALEAYGDTLRMAEKLVSLARAPSTFGDGAVVVAAAGNESKRDQSRDYALAASLPAAAEGVVSVGAAARDGSRFDVGPFSNAPLVCAPGVAVVSAQAGGGLVAMTGTSMACPHVAGVAALWWEALREQRLPVSAELVMAKLLAGARPDVFSAGVRIADRGVGLVSAPHR